MRTSQKITGIVTTIGIDIGKNTFHLVGFDQRGAIILQQNVSRSQLERRVANIPRCLIGMEACSGSHHIGRQLAEIDEPEFKDPTTEMPTPPSDHTPLRR